MISYAIPQSKQLSSKQNRRLISKIQLISQKMGSVCNPTTPLEEHQSEQKVKRKDSIHIQGSNEQSIDFRFTTDKLIHLNGDLLILFVDRSLNLRKNDHLIKIPLQASKLEEYARAKVQKKSMDIESTNFISFGVMIPTLNYKLVSLVFCEIWENDGKSLKEFTGILEKYFLSLKEIQNKTIIIPQFTSQLGIPLQKGMKVVIKQILKHPKKPQKIHLCCLNEQSQQVLSNLIDKNKQDLSASFTSTASLASNYI